MEIHKPKLVHNWREFLTEIGTIVIGVLIALAAEQAVERFHWYNRVAATRKAVATETATNISYGIMRMRFAPCIEKRIDTLGKILDDASRTGTLPAVGEFGGIISPIWFSAEWDSLISSQTAAHFPHDELSGLNFIYISVARANARNLQEIEAVAQIDTIVGPGRRLDPESEARLRDALSRERLYNRGLSQAGVRIWKMASQQKLVFSADDLSKIERAQHMAIACPAMGKPMEANYGQGPWGFVLPEAEDTLKNPPPLQVAD